MKVRIEITDEGSDEAVIFCRKITPEIEELVNRIGQHKKYRPQLAFFKGEEQYYPSLDEILFFETENERVYAHTCKDSFETRQSLRELSTTLPNYFVRISKSTIANILHIFSIQKGIARVCHVTFRGTYKEVFVSRMYAGVLKEKMEERHFYEKT
jgi:DNA-binding LytR/AlgR family response regulator